MSTPTPTTTLSPPRPDAAVPAVPSPWRAPHLASSTSLRYALSVTARILAVLLFSGIDIPFIKGSVDLVFQGQEWMSWVIATLLTLGAVLIAMTAGFLARATRTPRALWAAHLPLVGWLFLGVAVVGMRFGAADWTVAPVLVEGMAPVVDETGRHHGTAVLLAFLYFASGVWSYVEGRHVFNPVAAAYLSGRARRDRLTDAVIRQSGITNRATEDFQRARGNLAAVESGHTAARAALRALADELQAESRILIANHLGDPRATGITEIAPARRSTEEAGR
jgi:hypothetical protein